MLRLHFEAPETITYAHGFALFKKRESFESETVKENDLFSYSEWKQKGRPT